MTTWLLICIVENVDMQIVTHWHHEPTESAIHEMIENEPISRYNRIYHVIKTDLPHVIFATKHT